MVINNSPENPRKIEWNVLGFNLTCDKQKPFIRLPAV